MPRDLPTGTVTFLFTDIEGSTRLLRELGTDVYADCGMRSPRRAVSMSTPRGCVLRRVPTAAGAVAAAASGQRALAAGPLTVRMGVHTGTPTLAAEGYVGIDVHRGARVGALAHGGQVIVSATTAALIGEPLQDLGRHRLRDFDAPAQTELSRSS